WTENMRRRLLHADEEYALLSVTTNICGDKSTTSKTLKKKPLLYPKTLLCAKGHLEISQRYKQTIGNWTPTYSQFSTHGFAYS
uniref:Uncharacterized protein n=1 Tax=Hippocampus comes TaxID=109280 RepID=A0A3Q2XEY6_HIPCM